MQARLTAAAAVLADYKRAAESADTAERAMWGARLADMLESVLDACGRTTSPGPGQSPPAGHSGRALSFCQRSHPALSRFLHGKGQSGVIVACEYGNDADAW
jgi:hypothetical protein